LRGHGKSSGPRGHTPSYDALLDDIAAFFKQIEGKYPDLPPFLYGHRMGGNLALNYALRRKPRLVGVISTAAGLRTALEEQKVKVIMARILGTLMPTMTLASGLDPKTLSRDPAVVQAYISDPLVHDRMTLGFGKIMLTAIPWTFEHAGELQLPLLIMHGTKDMLGYPRGSQEFAGLAPKEKVTLKMWDGFYHEIHNEPEKAEVFKVMLDWLDKH
jgi:alpha-beta hydrolase superfamily lysophospholipase